MAGSWGSARLQALTFIRALARNARGNTLVFVAAAMIPLMAIIGGGVDTARGYLAKERLQQACDAGSLAGRRAMSNGELSALVRSEALKFINFNFPQNSYETAAFTPQISVPDASTLAISMDTSLPTTIMALFGYRQIPLHVECKASQNFINTDVMLVLDTTGSMDDEVGGTKKIVALREAVMALYNQLKPIQDQLESHGMRLRYGIVPYSSTVNVGKLLPTSYIRTSTPYLVASSCNWYGCTYTNQVRDVSAYVTGTKKDNWGGCIEERATVSTIDGNSGYSVPSGALDLNLSLVPSGGSSSTSKWPPYLPDVQQGESQVACPTQATRLKTFAAATDMQTAIDKLSPNGGTYHDIGMIWGGRLIARNGLFPTDNPATYNGMRVNRHIIFMTDGILDTGSTLYSAYGVERYQQRVSGTYTNDTDLDSRHRKRFQIMCNEVKGEPDVTIWVIGFDTTLSSELTECASSPDKAVVASNRDELIDQFTLIGKNIGALRLSE
ncbi:MAG TPA: Tad domain-containing protein [Sphingomonas sp.]|nr:Tad domain-containing protein [Sphingomonas sp.]